VAEEKTVFHNHQDSHACTKRLNSNRKSVQHEQAAQPPKQPHCPECLSIMVYRDGWRQTTEDQVQRFLCRHCGHRFSEKKPPQKPPRRYIYSSIGSQSISQVCELLTEDSKNLAEITRQEPASREGTKQNALEQKSRMAELAWALKKANYADETIRMVNSALRTLVARGADISNPETVKETIARQNWSENRRRNVANAYNLYANKYGIEWEKPRTSFSRKLPFIPKEDELDSLVAGSHKKLSSFLQLLKETGMRSGEATRLKWTDLDEERRVIILNKPEKGSNPRIWKISTRLLGMLESLKRKNEYIFGNPNTRAIRASFCDMRRSISQKLQNPRLMRISFHTFRHWKATNLYHQTKNILLVKEFLGHASLENTLLYIQVEQAIFGLSNDDEYEVTATNDKEDIKKLISVGFEYICQKDDILFFRKRK